MDFSASYTPVLELLDNLIAAIDVAIRYVVLVLHRCLADLVIAALHTFPLVHLYPM
jgi:hypothetical protein